MKTLTFFSNLGKVLLLPVAVVMLSTATALAQPANDLCSGAIVVTCGQTVTGNTTTATIDQTPDCNMVFPRYGVWYRFQGTGQTVTLSTCSSATNYDTQIGVYSGSCTALTCVAGNNNFCGRQSQVTFTSAPGTTYFILVTGVVDARGAFSLSVTCTGSVVVPNDACSGAVAVTCGQTVTGSTTGATADAVGTCVTTLNTAPGVWYSLVGNGGTATVSLCGSSYDTKVGVFSGTCAALVCVAGNDDFCSLQSQVSFSTVSGTTYYILVTGFSTASGNFTMAVTCTAPPPPAGDPACVAATPLVCGSSVTGTTTGGTVNTALGTCGTSLITAPGRWHTLFVPNSGSVTVTTCNAGSNYDTKLGVFSGTCANLACIGGNDDAACSFSNLRSTVTFTAVGGTTYRIYVTGFGAANGNYELSATCPVTLTAPTNTGIATVGETVSLGDGNLTVGQVFPNPLTGNTANIRIESSKETEAMVRFMDQMGREVMLIESDLNVGENLLQLNTARLAAGTYFVKIQVEGQIITRRLVIPRA